MTKAAQEDLTGMPTPKQDERTPGLFRKKPVVLEAFELKQRFPWPDWFHDAVSSNSIITHGLGKYASGEVYCEIKTLEGVMRADAGDWIIRGVKGEIYPCKPDIFAELYDPAEACNAYGSTDALRSTLQACAEFLRNKGIPCGAYSMPAPGEIDAAQAAFDRELEAIIEEMKVEVPRMVEQRGARAIDTALSGSPAPSTEGLRELAAEARFLLNRLSELSFDDLDDHTRDFNGHVEPSISRLSKILDAIEARTALAGVTAPQEVDAK